MRVRVRLLAYWGRRPVVESGSVPGRLKLVRRQAEVAERRPERLACIDSVQELLSHLYWEPRLRPASKACRSCIVLRFPALGRIRTLPAKESGYRVRPGERVVDHRDR